MLVNLFVMLFIMGLGIYFLHLEERINYLSPNGSDNAVTHSKRKQFIIIVSIVLILQSGLRHVTVGSDTYTYYIIFERIKLASWQRILEMFKIYYTLGVGKDPGYSIFQKLVQYLIKDYQLYLLFVAVIFFSALGHFIYKNTTRLTDALFAFILFSALFYAFFSITGTRQTIVTAATLYGYELIKKRKLLYFLIIMLLASTIHKSVLAFIPFYFLYNVRFVYTIYTASLLALPFVFINRVQVSAFFKTLGGYENYGIYEGAGTPTFTLMMILIAIGAFIRFRHVNWLSPEANPYYVAFALALFFVPLTWVNPSAMRVVQYYSIFMLLLIPMVINSFVLESIKWKQFLFVLTIIVLFGLFLKTGSESGSEYKFFWERSLLNTK